MALPISLALFGLGVGGIYALIAIGLVIVYRGSGVINFAQGAFGMTGAYLFWQLSSQHGWPLIPSIIAGLILSAVLGFLVQVLVMQRLRSASTLAKLLATLGVLTSLDAIVSLAYPEESVLVAPFLPQRSVSILGTSLGENRIIVFVASAVITAGLWAVYRYTSFGRKTSATAENPIAASALGHSPDRIAAINWAIGSTLAGAAGILLAPIEGLSVTALTLLIVPALAAAVVGNLISFPLTFVGAIVIGIAQQEVGTYVTTPGWSDAVPFIVIVIIMSIRGAYVPGKLTTRLRLPGVGDGRIRKGPLAISIVCVVIAILFLPADWVIAVTVTIVASIIILSVVVVAGYAGQISLAQFAMAGIGAYVAGRLVAVAGLSFLAALVIGALGAFAVGLIIGVPALRTRGSNLAIVTLAMSAAIESVLFDSYTWTGGSVGTVVGNPYLFGLNINDIIYPRRYAFVTLACIVLLSLGVANLRRGRIGRRMLAIRANERAAASLGIGLVSTKLYAFAVGAFIASIGGILLAFMSPSIVYSNFDTFDNVTYLGMSVIGGIGYVIGPLFGGQLIPGGIGTQIGASFGSSFQEWLLLLSGLILILILIQSPDGIAADLGRQLRFLRWRRARTEAGTPRLNVRVGKPSGRARSAGVPKSLIVRDICVNFGGAAALSGVSLVVDPGQVVGLIGPNGAGKTTLVDAVTGFVRQSSGSIWIGDQDVSRASIRKRSRLGLGRSFQQLELFEDLTVLENILVACETVRWYDYVICLFVRTRSVLSSQVLDVIRDFGLEDMMNMRPPELAYGTRRLVAIARAMALNPSILLLDEPAAGLSEAERVELRDRTRSLAENRGLAIVVIEHDVNFMMSMCDRIKVLDFGREIANGSPEDVRRDSAVVSAYLGTPIEESQ
jgi:ABC-type branched-subunit amino acid transport system ATPase component/branched-subunit amino acid ABC-type transport system permease component